MGWSTLRTVDADDLASPITAAGIKRAGDAERVPVQRVIGAATPRLLRTRYTVFAV